MLNHIKTIFHIRRQLSYILTKKQKRDAVGVFFCMLLGSALELLGLSVIYPFLQLMMDETAMRDKWYLQWIFSAFPEITTKDVLIMMCIFIIMIYLVKNAVALLCVYIQNRYAAVFQRELSTSVLQSIMQRPYEFFINTNSADVMQRVHGDTFATYGVLLNLFTFISNLLTLLLIGAYLIYTDLRIAIAALALAFSCFLLIVLTFRKRLKKAGKDMMEASAEQAKASNEAVYGIKEVTVMDRRDCFVEKFAIASKKVERITILNSFLSACPDRILEGICIGGFIGMAGIRIMMGANPAEFVPILGAFALGAFRMLPAISKMSSSINGMVFNRPRLVKCYENLKEAERFEKEQRNIVLAMDRGADAESSVSFSNMIEIRNVSWRYQNADEIVLNDLTLTIKKGEAIALIGASGAGKTTLGDVLLGLFRPQKGGIYMDGIDVQTIPHTWCKTIGYVPQSVFLIDDSIRANVAFGLPDDLVDEKQVWRALEQAQLADFVRELPDGLDTVVGERGVKFSGGQRQRVAIARALYENPQILVLDEATSALDTETETAVMESIDALLGQKTLIIIAHRLSTIRNCNKVYEIKDGKAIERDKNEVLASETEENLRHNRRTLFWEEDRKEEI